MRKSMNKESATEKLNKMIAEQNRIWNAAIEAALMEINKEFEQTANIIDIITEVGRLKK